MLWDAHSHLSFYDFSTVKEILNNQYVDRNYILGGYSKEDWIIQIKIKNQWPNRIKTGFGIHPWTLKENINEMYADLKYIEENINSIDFIGETGFDKKRTSVNIELSTQVFVEHLKLSNKYNKPLILHIVGHYEEALNCLNYFNNSKFSGILHGFSGSLEIAKMFIEKGFYIGIGQNIINPHFKKLRKLILELEPEYLVFESDFPSIHHTSFDPQIDPLMITIKKFAELKNISILDTIDIHNQNCQNLF